MKDETIYQLLSELKNNPLNDRENAAYRRSFVENMRSVPDSKYEKVKQLLCGNGRFGRFKFNQGISELLVWFLFERSGIGYDTDVSENPINDRNIDVVAKDGSVRYNIEIKSPEYAICPADTLKGRFAFRSCGKEQAKEQMDGLADLLRQQLPANGYNSVETLMPSDNKIKDCLQSCQKKFIGNSAENLNILFLCTTTEEMMSYILYLTNAASGFLTENSYCDRTEYDKVFAVIVSNALTLNERKNDSAWDLSEAINIIIPNIFCAYRDRNSFSGLLQFFPNRTIEYATGLCEYTKKYMSEMGDPDLINLMYFPDFVARLGFSMRTEKRSDE